MKFMASHGQVAFPATSLCDGEATDQVGFCRPSSVVFVPVFVLVLVVSFSQFHSDAAEPRVIVTKGILNTSVADS